MRKVSEDIKKGTFQRLYVMYGEEAYLRKDFVDRLIQALVPEGDLMNFTKFVGKDVRPGEVIDTAETMPMFAERRVILLEDTGFLKNACEELAAYVKNLPDYLVMVFNESQVDKRNGLYKAAAKVGDIEVFEPMKGDELASWVQSFMKMNHKQMAGRDCQLLVSRVGADMGLLRQEMEKLLAYTQGRTLVTAEDIGEICSVSITDRMFDMIRAITNQDQEKALSLYYDLLSLKVSPVKILTLLGREYMNLLKARDLAGQGYANADLARFLGIPAFAVRTTMAVAGRYTAAKLRGILQKIGDADMQIKSGAGTDQLTVEVLIVALAYAQE